MSEHECNHMITVVEVDESAINDLAMFPAIENVGNKVYILHGDKIVGIGIVGSGHGAEVTVYYESDKHPFWKDDWAVAVLGKHAGFKFLKYDGKYFPTYPDEPESRTLQLEDYAIVDKHAFDFGFASEKRYSHIEGFGKRGVGMPS